MGVYTFETDLPADPSVPSYMRGPRTQTILSAVGQVLSDRAEQVLWGRLQALPFAGGPTLDRSGAAQLADGRLIECAPFVLPIHAQQRGIRIWPSEPELSVRFRVSRHLSLKQLRGTPWGTLLNVQPFWLPGTLPWMRYFFQTNEGTPRSVCYTLGPNGERFVQTASPSILNWDNQPVKRSRFWIFIHLPPGYLATSTYDGSTLWDSAAIWDGIGQQRLDDLAGAFDSWHAAHEWFAGLIVTALQPTDDIPGHPGVHPFDPLSAVTTNADGSTNLPNGAWGSAVYLSGPNLGLNTRPSWALFYAINNG